MHLPLQNLQASSDLEQDSGCFSQEARSMELSKPPLTPQSNAQLQAIAWRMLSIPDLVCATADGAGLLLPLEHLQVSICIRFL